MGLTKNDLLRMVVLRGLGYSQEQIASELGVTQNTVSYYLSRFEERAKREGPTVVFWSLVLGPLGAPPVVLGSLNRILEEIAEEAPPEKKKWGW